MPSPIYGPYTLVPFGASVSVSGNPAFAGGQTRTYANFDLQMFSNVYWGPISLQAAMDGAIDAPGELLTFGSISGNGLTATWIGQTTIPLFNGVGYTNTTVFTRFVAQISGASGNAAWLDSGKTDPAIVGGPAVLVDVDETVNQFTVSLSFQASFTQNGVYQSFLTLYDNAPTPPGNPPGTSGPALTSANFNFYLQDNPNIDSGPVWQNHNGAAAYIEGAPAVRLDPNVTIFDSELAGLNNGAGNFGGASFSIAGLGGDNQLTFLSSPNFTFNGGSISDSGGHQIAAFGEVNGQPALIFSDQNGGIPTTELVSDILRSLAYFNTSHTPAPTASITLTFYDGTGNSTAATTVITITDVPNGDGVIGDFVWNDLNRNGLQDVNERGISGIRLQLASSSAPSVVLAETVTDQKGLYQFTGLFSGDYIVRVVSSSVPGGYVVSLTNQGSNDNIDSDFSTISSNVGVTLLTDNSVVNNVDLGLYDSNNQPPTAFAATFNIDEDQNLFSSLPAGSDPNNDQLNYVLSNNASHGSVVIQASGQFEYHPLSNYNGQDTFSYFVTDGAFNSAPVTVTINIASVNDHPEIASFNFSTNEDTSYSGTLPVAFDPDGDTQRYIYDNDAQHGTVVVNTNGTFTYVPNANYSGPDTFHFHSNDGISGNSNLATATVNISSVDDAPTADNDAYVATYLSELNVPFSTGVLNGDVDVEGDALSAALQTTPSKGTLALNADGSFAYTPLFGMIGLDTFTYIAFGAGVSSNLATVTLTINPSASATQNADYLVGTGVNDTIDGLAGDDFLRGGSGTDSLFGGLGNDHLFGGSVQLNQFNTLDGGEDADTASYDDATGSVYADLRSNGGFIDGVLTDLFTSIENLSGSDNADFLFGNTGDNVLDGGLGDDQLYGNEGNDTLRGGGHSAGSYNVLDGGSGSDTVDYNAESGDLYVVTFAGSFDVQAGPSYVLRDLLFGMENANGGSGNDLILGADNVANRLSGGGGNDFLYGYSGDDVLIGGTAGAGGFNYLSGSTGNDTASYEGMSQSVYADAGIGAGWLVSGNSYVLTDIYESIENLTGGNASDTLIGSSAANVIEGGASGDALYANSGTGFDGQSDRFVYRQSSDSLISNFDTVYNFQSGSDKFDFRPLGINASNIFIANASGTTVVYVNADTNLDYEMAIVLQTPGTTAVIGDMLV